MEAQQQSNTFGSTLGLMRSGACLSELSDQLTELVAKVRETGENGTLTLQIKVKPASRGGINALILEDKITLKLPEMERAQSLFFATEANTLQRNDPAQKEMEFKTVTGGEAPQVLKNVNVAG